MKTNKINVVLSLKGENSVLTGISSFKSMNINSNQNDFTLGVRKRTGCDVTGNDCNDVSINNRRRYVTITEKFDGNPFNND